MKQSIISVILLLVIATVTSAQSYDLSEIAIPKGERFEVGGMDFKSNGDLVISTRRGRVWIISEVDSGAPKFSMFAEGMQDCLGLKVIDDVIYVVQRGEVSRLLDTDADGTADVVECVTDDWGVSGNYHEYAFGLPLDREGNMYVSLNVPFLSPKWWLGASPVPYRGWVMKIAPDGTTKPFACGLRSPCGINTNPEGELFVTDNQGDWMPACPLFHIEEGKFYGHPASLRWRKDYLAEEKIPSQINPPAAKRTQPALWLPYRWTRSAAQMIVDTTKGNFGPFAGQMFISELTNGNVLRVDLQKVRGQYQGAAFMFRKEVGSAVRLAWSPKGDLVIGRTNRGWGGLEPGDGLAILKWNKSLPFEMKTARLTEDGFKIEFTKEVKDPDQVAKQIKLMEYDYNYWWEYGSPIVHEKPLKLEQVTWSDDGKSATLQVTNLHAGKVVRCTLSDVSSVDGTPLVNNQFNYTINELLTGPPAVEVVAKAVTPPAAKESPYEGWVYLNKIDGKDRWQHEGWQEIRHREKDIVLDPKDERKIMVVESADPNKSGADGQSSPISILADEGSTKPAVSKVPHGAVETWFDVYLPKKGSVSVFFQGRYELRFEDDPEGKGTKFGVVPAPADKKTVTPQLDVYRGPGKWHVLHMKFYPPQFDDQGKKFLDASFKDVTIDGTLLYESVDLFGSSPGAPITTESPEELGVQWRVNQGRGAFRRMSLKRLNTPSETGDWVSVFNGTDIDQWKRAGEATWSIKQNAIVGTGKMGHLFSPRSHYKNFELKARVKINDNGNSGLYFRTTFGEGWPAGYEAQVNSTYKDPVKTGSLYNFDLIKAMFVEPGIWFDYHVTCRDVKEGVHIQIRVNDLVVVDFVDAKRTHKSGHIALQQHHEGSEVWFRDIKIRELND